MLDLKAVAPAFYRQLEEHEHAIPIDEYQQADDVPPTVLIPPWSIASTSTVDLSLEPNTLSPFAQDTLIIDKDVPYTRRSFSDPYVPNPPTNAPRLDANTMGM